MSSANSAVTPPHTPVLQNFPALDSLRGLLAVYVVAGHARWLLWTGHANWITEPHSSLGNGIAFASAGLRFGHEAVMVFFALSGFFIHMRMAKNPNQKFIITDYADRRIRRIIPPYMFALLLTILADTIGRHLFPTLYSGKTSDPMLNKLFLLKTYSAKSVISALACVPSSLGEDFGSNGPLWSIGYEMIYYCLYPLWLFTRRTSAVLAYFAIPATLLLTAGLIPFGYFGAVLIKYPIWIAGAGLAEIAVNHSQRRNSLLILGTLMLLAIGVSTSHTQLIHICIGVSVVGIFGSLPDRICRWKLSKTFEYIGIRSYTLYACHFPILVLISAWLIETRGNRPPSALPAFLGTAISVSIGLICFEICERKFLNRRAAPAPNVHRALENA